MSGFFQLFGAAFVDFFVHNEAASLIVGQPVTPSWKLENARRILTLDCDFLACSAYKFYGPHLGVLWGRRELLDALDVPKLQPAPDWSPERVETGTLSHEGIAGAAAAVDFLASLAGAAPGRSRRDALGSAFAGLHVRGRRLFEGMWEGLAAIDGVRLYGPPPSAPRTPTVSFTVAGRPADSVAEALGRRGVFASSGDFYAWTVVDRLGHTADGVVRAGCACYTTSDEVDRLIEGVIEIAGAQPSPDGSIIPA